MSYSNKEERDKCYAVRDKYWQCLDKNAPLYLPNSGEAEPEICREFRNLYEAGCRQQWIKHFEDRRAYEQSKKIKIERMSAKK